MKPQRRVTASLASAFTLVAVIAAWIAFAPPQLGGQTSYVIVSGNSMEPGMHRGDLAVIREQSRYGVGDVVTYRHPQIGRVIHRVIGTEGSRFVFQGDHNDFIDPYRPVQEEMVGKLWFHVPGVGAWLTRFHSPPYLAGLLIVAFAGLGGGAAAAQSTRKPRRGRNGRERRQAVPGGAAQRGTPTMNPLLRNWQDTLSLLVAAAFGLALLAWISFGRETSYEVTEHVSYTQTGEFSYSAASGDGRVYDGGAATSGDPVYQRLSEAIRFTFAYALESEAAMDVSGTYHLVAELGDKNGWRRTIPLSPETTFSGREFTVAGVLSLAEARELMTILEEQSGVENREYTLTVNPQVTVAGITGGVPFDTVFEAAVLQMEIDDIQFRLARDPQEAKLTAQLTPSGEGSVATPVSKTATMSFLIADVPVSAVRVISLGLLGLVLIAGGIFALAIVRGGGTDAVPGAAKLKSPVVSVQGESQALSGRVIDVMGVEDIARIAETCGGIVLQEARPGFHAYFVYDGDIAYRYQAVGTPAIPAAQAQDRGAA